MARKPRLARDPRLETLRKLGERVRILRFQRGFTQQDLAEMLGISIPYMSLIERGCRNPPYTTVVAIAEALGVRVREMCSE